MNPRLLAAAVLLGGLGDNPFDFRIRRPEGQFGFQPKPHGGVAQIQAAGEVAPGTFGPPQKQPKKNVNRPKIPRKRRFK